MVILKAEEKPKFRKEDQMDRENGQSAAGEGKYLQKIQLIMDRQIKYIKTLKPNDQNTAQAMCDGGHFFNLSTQEAEVDGSLWALGQPGLYSEWDPVQNQNPKIHNPAKTGPKTWWTPQQKRYIKWQM